MGPKPQTPQSGDLFRFPLAEHCNDPAESAPVMLLI
jgi:hypothetical protein